MASPAWLGIGAQRSGTTWFTDLLTQHPQVGLGTNGKKEQHLLHKVADGSSSRRRRTSTCSRRRRRTPRRLDAAVRSATPRRRRPRPGYVPDAPVLVLLRDPVERFRSAMRLARDPAGRDRQVVVALPGADHGADVDRLLRRPARRLGAPGRPGPDGRDGLRGRPGGPADRRRRTSGGCSDWTRSSLRDVESASGSSSRADWDWPEGLKESLEVLYAPQVARLARRVGPGPQLAWTATRPVSASTSRPVRSNGPRRQPRPARLLEPATCSGRPACAR